MALWSSVANVLKPHGHSCHFILIKTQNSNPIDHTISHLFQIFVTFMFVPAMERKLKTSISEHTSHTITLHGQLDCEVFKPQRYYSYTPSIDPSVLETIQLSTDVGIFQQIISSITQPSLAIGWKAWLLWTHKWTICSCFLKPSHCIPPPVPIGTNSAKGLPFLHPTCDTEPQWPKWLQSPGIVFKKTGCKFASITLHHRIICL